MRTLDASSTEGENMMPSFHILGVRVDAVQTDDAVRCTQDFIERRKTGCYVAVTGMHGVAEARQDPRFREILNRADLVVPDGMPLVWVGRWHRHSLRRRVPGSELMLAFCEKTGSRYRHFFYGGAPGVAEDLAERLRRRYQINAVGIYSPPFRPLTEQEERELCARIECVSPDVLWVGLSTPKQEKWMYQHCDKFKVPVMLGVGAAFDMNSGRTRRAPEWMQESGLEWLFRLLKEPRRLGKRYLVTIPRSIWSVSLELAHIRKFE
jgi:N-acetylglucosaminyldiphosphoundecaprenol N-acetyl-beta-D-mannosaminyltransferase